MVARASPIRDMILKFLSQPRSARQVAEHIARPVPVATGHLAAMGRRGLAKRIGSNAYAAADYIGPPVDFSRKGKRIPLRRVVHGLLAGRLNLIALRRATGAPDDEIRAVLREMWLSGAVAGDEENGFVLKAAKQ